MAVEASLFDTFFLQDMAPKYAHVLLLSRPPCGILYETHSHVTCRVRLAASGCHARLPAHAIGSALLGLLWNMLVGILPAAVQSLDSRWHISAFFCCCFPVFGCCFATCGLLLVVVFVIVMVVVVGQASEGAALYVHLYCIHGC